MKIFKNFSLQEHNTFGIQVITDYYIQIEDRGDLNLLTEQIDFSNDKYFILGVGSNILFTNNFNGYIIQNRCSEIKVTEQNNDYYLIRADAGCIWDNFVEFCLNTGVYGAENLSGIPGTVGASAVQNIGAYGREVSEFIYKVEFFDLIEKQFKTISANDCKFTYRNSIFKNELKDRALITSVTYRFPKKNELKINYADLEIYFSTNKIEINPISIRNAVLLVRNSKLPDYKITGNAGSFFKNPIVDSIKFKHLLSIFPDLKYFPVEENKYKIAAGWMIDKCGLKGFVYENAAVHEKQALVLINKTGKATGREILELSEMVKAKVFNTFEVTLESEVIIL